MRTLTLHAIKMTTRGTNFTISKAVENKSEFFSCSVWLARGWPQMPWLIYEVLPHWNLPLLHFLHPKQINLSLFWSQYIWHLLYIRPIFNILFYYFIQYDISNTNISLILFCKYVVYVPIEILLLWSHCLINCCLIFFF